MTSPFLLTPKDLDANPLAACGQTAVAALLERPLADVMPAFPPHSWCNLRDMQAALTKLVERWRPTPPDQEATRLPGRSRPALWPSRGLVQLFFNGPWDAPEVPIAASYKASHWVAVITHKDGARPDPWVFDVNVLDANINNGWVPRSYWEREILAPLIASYKRATGGWWVRAGIEVARG